MIARWVMYASVTTLLAVAGPQAPVGDGRLPINISAYFAGSWSGTGTFASGKPISSDVTFEPILDGEALLMRGKERSPNRFAYVALWSVDTSSGKPVVQLTSNLGSGARLFRSDGWNGGTLVVQSVPELRSYFALERFTFDRLTERTYVATYSFSRDSGATWKVGDRQTFNKV